MFYVVLVWCVLVSVCLYAVFFGGRARPGGGRQKNPAAGDRMASGGRLPCRGVLGEICRVELPFTSSAIITAVAGGPASGAVESVRY